MSTPYWVPMGGEVVTWKGTYAAGTQYQPGDVVSYNGVNYVCVFPSLGNTPPVALTVLGLTPIQDILLAAPGTFDFLSIPQTFKHLRLECYLRGDIAAAVAQVNARFNNDSGANYHNEYLQGTGATAAAAEQLTQTSGRLGRCPGSTAPANSFGAVSASIPSYASTVGHKPVLTSDVSREAASAGNTYVEPAGFVWFAAPAGITRITILPSSGNFIAGSEATLYGMA